MLGALKRSSFTLSRQIGLTSAVADSAWRRRRLMMYTPAGAMAETLRRLESEHGDAAAYLRAGGLDAAGLGAARDRLLAA